MQQQTAGRNSQFIVIVLIADRALGGDTQTPVIETKFALNIPGIADIHWRKLKRGQLQAAQVIGRRTGLEALGWRCDCLEFSHGVERTPGVELLDGSDRVRRKFQTWDQPASGTPKVTRRHEFGSVAP